MLDLSLEILSLINSTKLIPVKAEIKPKEFSFHIYYRKNPTNVYLRVAKFFFQVLFLNTFSSSISRV